jgi:hypothetical protein
MSLFGLFGPPDVNKLRTRRDLNGLVKALRNKKHNSVRMDAAKALGEIKDKSAVEPLIEALREDGASLSLAAAQALKEIGDTRAIKPILETLRLMKDNTSPYAFDYLKSTYEEILNVVRLFGASAIEVLLEELRDHDPSVRRRAAEMLDLLDWQPGSDEAGAWYWITRRDWKQCLKIGEAAIPALKVALSNEPEKIKVETERLDPTAFGSFYDGVSVEVEYLPNPDRAVIENILEEISQSPGPDRG